jgi:nucleoside-diphosphate-sugar epimerase
MRVVVTGATGNVGISVVAALSNDARVESVVGVARRAPQVALPKVEWCEADIRRSRLEPIFAGADAVVHLAWLIQPSKKPAVLASVNVHGSRRVFEATAAARVGTLVHASSVGVYSPAAGPQPVDEAWPTRGIPSCSYSRDKASAERILDAIEAENPALRVVRMRPGLVLKRSAGAEVTRYFLGDWIPRRLVPSRLPALPLPRGLVLQAVHSHDVASAYLAAVTNRGAHGAYNVAAEPLITADAVHQRFGTRVLPVPPAAMRAAMSGAWHAGLQPTDPGWFDMAMQSPVMDCTRARDELDWTPKRSSLDALADVLGGVRDQTSLATPALR